MKGLTTDTATGDLLLSGTTAAITDCEEQIIETVVLACRGELKEIPLIGGEARLQLGGNIDVLWAPAVKKMIKAVGVDVSKVTMDDDGNVTIY